MISNDEDPLNTEDKNAVFILLSRNFDAAAVKEQNTSLNAFLIEASTPGVVLKKQLSNFNGLNLYELECQNVKLTDDQLLGVDGSGHDIAAKLFETSRYMVGAICLGLIKDLFQKTVEFAINSRRFNKSISEFEIIKLRLSEIETTIYTMERYF